MEESVFIIKKPTVCCDEFHVSGHSHVLWWGSFYFTFVHAQGTFGGSQLIWAEEEHLHNIAADKESLLSAIHSKPV